MRRYTLATLVAAATLAGLSAPQAIAAASPTSQDRTFLVQAHQGNLAEIAAGKDAGKHATTVCVKRAGQTWVHDHTKLDASVRKLADKTHTRLPSSPSAAQQKALQAVQSKAGSSAYDEAWLKAQAAAHRKTLAAIDQEIKHGTNSGVVAAARTARPMVAMHLDMVRDGVCHQAPHSTHHAS
ncbi:DUF4142 domain-containing protein [Streptomyces sp. NPDC059582]|uniref:DUF4142 domain-containing protein n=1 Tax=Streptomyces sp. NPDC059582 TaxID=3346875 RepID=UPI003683CAB2